MKKAAPRPPSAMHKGPNSMKVRTDLSSAAIERAIMDNMFLIQGRVPRTATRNDWYMAVAYTVRDRIMHRWMSTIETYMGKKDKSVSYFSAEFLIG
ncbi:MAG TPA: hypothetical protein VJN65_07405, partial [Bacteroidota bacterium]|nr:hypothetical protein [Bacteroidota bacterium]